MEVYFISLLIIVVFSNILSLVGITMLENRLLDYMKKNNLEYATIKEKYMPNIIDFFKFKIVREYIKYNKLTKNINKYVGEQIEKGNIVEKDIDIVNTNDNDPSIFKSKFDEIKEIEAYKALRHTQDIDIIPSKDIDEENDHDKLTPFILKNTLEKQNENAVEHIRDDVDELIYYISKLPRDKKIKLMKKLVNKNAA